MNNLQNKLVQLQNKLVKLQKCNVNIMQLKQFIGENQSDIQDGFVTILDSFIERESGLCKKPDREEITINRMTEIDKILYNSNTTSQDKQNLIIKYIQSIQGRNPWTGQLYRFGGKRKTHKRKHRRTKRKSHKKRRTHRK